MKTRLLKRLRKEANRTYRKIIETRDGMVSDKYVAHRYIVNIQGYMFEVSMPQDWFTEEEMKKIAINHGIESYVRIKKYGRP